MDVKPKDDKANRIRTLLDAYGIGVRGGVLTPCLADENWFRSLIGLEPAGEEVKAEWGRTNGVRLPITLQKGLADADAGTKPSQPTNEGTSDE
jgi:hypothetical protein